MVKVKLHPCIKFKQTHNPSLSREQREEEERKKMMIGNMNTRVKACYQLTSKSMAKTPEFMMPTAQLKMRGSSVLKKRSIASSPYKNGATCKSL